MHQRVEPLELYFVYPSHNPFKGSKIKMFDFGTSTGQVVNQSSTNNGTSNGQAVVSINKHIQTMQNTKSNNKQGDFKNSNFQSANGYKQKLSVPYQDNLKTSTDKNYDDPL
ncbi:hypothetical protein [Zunongwangia profunda]|uniref:hypothetical protein n=1 Tax=Zunongwangia profunda TaxID=398743 RepID=UPI002934DD97|nr:hypothetical protein [Zunongwangia profunda]